MPANSFIRKIAVLCVLMMLLSVPLSGCSHEEKVASDSTPTSQGVLNESEHVKQIWANVLPRYEEVEALCNGNPLTASEEQIEYDGHYYFVLADEQYKSMSDIYEAVENAYTKEYAENFEWLDGFYKENGH